jgi:hypothetical protein
MFNSYEEAREYARTRSREESEFIGVILTKNGKYNVAYDWDEAEYAERHGWELCR